MAFFYEEGEEKKRSGVFMRHVNIGTIAEDEDGNGSYAPSRIFIDPTLTQEGEAAEAKATGDAINALAEQTNQDLDELSEKTETAISDLQDATEEAINSLAAIGVIEDTKSGEVVSISDSAAYKMQGLRLYGKSRQATTTGAQLLDIREEIASSSASITATTDGTGAVIINGTAGDSGQGDIYFIGSWDSQEVVFEEDTYTYSVYGLSADETMQVINNQSVVESSIGTKNCTVTSQITGLSIRLKAGKTYSNLKIYPMLSASSSAKPWEPYTGGKPSPSPEYPQEIESAGEVGNITTYVFGQNLIDPMDAGKWRTANNATFEILGNGKIKVTGTNIYSGINYVIPTDTVNLLKGKNCVISRTIDSSTNESAQVIAQIVVYALSGTKYYSAINTPITIGADATGADFRLNVNNTGDTLETPNTVVFSNLGIYLGDTAQSWDTYRPIQTLSYPTPNGLPGIPVESGGNYTDADGQQWVCDEVDFGRGKYVQRVKIRAVESGDAGAISSLSTEKLNRCYIIAPGKLPQNTGVRCNLFTYSKDYIYNTVPENYIIDEASTNVLFAVSKSYGSTFDEIRQKLITAGAKILYVLATPIETDLTTEQLTAYAALTTYKLNTTITTNSDPTAGIGVDYIADTKAYIDNKFAQLAELSTVVNALIGADE